MLTFCKRCVMPHTKPDLKIDDQGICSACRSFEQRRDVDWVARRSTFLESLRSTARETVRAGIASCQCLAARTAHIRYCACGSWA